MIRRGHQAMAVHRRAFLSSTALAGSALLLARTAAMAAPGDALNMLFDAMVKESLQAFDFGGSAGFGGSPYVISQLTGAYQNVPNFLDTKHTIQTAEDADAYLSRLEAFASQLDSDTQRLAHDSALNIVPPDFIIDLALEQLNKTRQPADRAVAVTSLARRVREKSLPESYAASAARI